MRMAGATTITIHVPAALRGCCEGARSLFCRRRACAPPSRSSSGSHPSLYRSICDETGAVRRHMNLFVNTTHMRDRDGLDTALAPGDVVTILPAVSGG